MRVCIRKSSHNDNYFSSVIEQLLFFSKLGRKKSRELRKKKKKDECKGKKYEMPSFKRKLGIIVRRKGMEKQV